MNEVIDRKFRILAINPCKQGAIYTERDGVFFCAKDAAFPAALEAYYKKCEELGCEPEHLESIQLLQERVYSRQLYEKRLPDTESDCEIDRCIGGINIEE